MGRRNNDAFAETIVGVFMIAVIALLAYFTIVISGGDLLNNGRRVSITVVFDEVGGLKDHDSVMYRGTKVGAIDGVEVTPSNLVVTARIDRNVTLREKCRISVCNLSMLGGNYLLLEEGEGAIVDLMKVTFKGETPTDWMKDVTEVAKNLKGVTEMEALRSIITNVDAIAINLNRIVSRVEGGEGTLGKLMSADATLYDELDASVKAFRKAAESLDGKDTVAKLDKLIDNLNTVAERLKNGEGTLGKLVNDRKMYDEIDGIIRDARQVLDNYRDTTPISTFSSLATGAL